MNLPIDYLLRTTAVLALAFLVTWALRRQPAAFRHVIWICAFSIAALTPVLSRFGPRFQFERPAPGIAPQATPSVVSVVDSPLPSTPSIPSRNIPIVQILWIAGIVPFAIRAWNASRNARAILKHSTVIILPQAPSSRVAESDEITTPLTLGIFRPWILLPTKHRLWEADRLRAVLLHELAHVRRRDCLVQWLPNIVCAVNWFNPLAWLARSEMLCESERACDDAVIRSGIAGNSFAQDLVDIARSIQLKGDSFMSTALTTKLERRIQRLIDASANRSPLSLGRTIFGAALALVLLAPVAGVRADQVAATPAAAPAVQVTPEPAAVPEAAPAPAPVRAPRIPVPIAQVVQPAPVLVAGPVPEPAPVPQAAPVPQSAGTASLSGTVVDPTGAVIPNVTIRVTSNANAPSLYTLFTITTGPTGQWNFNGLTPGLYAIMVAVPGFSVFNKPVKIVSGSNDQGIFHLSLGRTSESLTITAQASNASTSQPKAQSSSQPIRVGGNVQPAKLIHRVSPVFPQDAKDKGIQGPVTVQAIIGKDGFIRDTLMVTNGVPELAQAASDAIRSWQFEPARLNGEPVETMTEITVNFQLQ